MGKRVEVVDPLDLSQETLDTILGSIPEKEDRRADLADHFDLKDDRQGLLSECGSCTWCTNKFPFSDLEKDSEGFLTCPSCLAAGNACSKCREPMPGIGSAAKVMCARCRLI